MKRSAQVSAPLLAAAALVLLTGCRKPEAQRCVDEQNRVVADSFCSSSGAAGRAVQGSGMGGGGGGMFFPVPIYRYYYGGSGGGIGSRVSGGGFAALPGHSYADSSAHSTGTVRGGFGSSHGGGSGESGGAGE